MRRITIPAVAAVLLFVATGAGAFTVGDYSGHVKHDPLASVGFDVDRNAGGHKVAISFTVGRPQYTCDTAPAGRGGGFIVAKGFRIKHREFDGKANVTDGGTDPVLKVHGKLLPGGIAKGTLRLAGQLDSGAPTANCNTGKLPWRAAKTS